MLSLPLMSIRLLALAGAALVADPAPVLRVLRTTPSGDAAPATTVTVTFDRPEQRRDDLVMSPRSFGLSSLSPLPSTAHW
jgi:hypothetical protein